MRVCAFHLIHGVIPISGEDPSEKDLIRTLIDFGFERMTAGRQVYLDFPKTIKDIDHLTHLPLSQTLMFVDRLIRESDDDAERFKELAKTGCKFVVESAQFPIFMEDIRQNTKVAVINVGVLDISSVKSRVTEAKSNRLRTLAIGVDSVSLYHQCVALGFDYFEGSFDMKPAYHPGREVPLNRAVLIHLMTRLQDPRVTIDELEVLVSSDVGLSFRLLRLVNSACAAVSERVESIRSALLILGIKKVVSLVSLLAISGIEDKPAQLLVTAMIRARMCELIAESMDYEIPEKYFTAGLLSILDALFDLPMETILQQMPLTSELNDALLNPAKSNTIGKVVDLVVRYESGDWSIFEQDSTLSGTMLASYVTSIAWAEEAMEVTRI